MPMEDVVQRMRLDVAVNVVRGDAFSVAFVSDDPRKAMLVADRLASLFINENLQDREMLGEATADFLQTQLEAARRRLADQEMKVADFQRLHAGELPSEREANLQALHNLQLQVQALLDSVNRDKDRRILLERTLADFEADAQARPVDEANLAAQGAAGSARSAATVGPGTTDDQLEAARNNLKALELHLKPEHPDVVYARRLVRDLEAKLAAESTQPAASAARLPRPRTAEEANTQRRVQEIRRELASLALQLESKQVEEKRLRGEIAGYEGRLASTPRWEAELIALTRDYETLQRGYASLLEKQESSKMSAALERSQSGEVFRVLDRARLPEAPASPNRLMINLVGAMAGLGHRAGPSCAPGVQGQEPEHGRGRAADSRASGAGRHSGHRDTPRPPAQAAPAHCGCRERGGRARDSGRGGVVRVVCRHRAPALVTSVASCTKRSTVCWSGHST